MSKVSRLRPAIYLPVSGPARLDRAFPIDDLARLQKAVGGYIEPVPLLRTTVRALEVQFGVTFGPCVLMFANEDGHRLGLAFNADASSVAGQAIVGDAIVVEQLEPEDDEPEGDDGPDAEPEPERTLLLRQADLVIAGDALHTLVDAIRKGYPSPHAESQVVALLDRVYAAQRAPEPEAAPAEPDA